MLILSDVSRETIIFLIVVKQWVTTI